MSFGTVERSELVQSAIDKAYSRRVLMFASASNNAGNDRTWFPANSDLVLPIFAADGDGNKYSKNPTPGRGYNFSTLGVCVKSWWPEHLEKGLEHRMTGTSTATPIAAGIAANVLHFFRRHAGVAGISSDQKLWLWSRLKTADGMKRVFEKMTEKTTRDGYDYVVPWLLFNGGGADQEDPKNIITKIKDAIGP